MNVKKEEAGYLKDYINTMCFKNHFIARVISLIEYWILPIRSKHLKEVEAVINTFVPNKMQKDRRYIRKIKKDMIYSRRAYFVTYSQYFIFNYEKLNSYGRHQFVGEFEKTILTHGLDANTWQYFKDKYQAYQKFKPFYKREIIKIESASDNDKIINFVKSHDKFMLKVIDDAEGRGIYKIDRIVDSISTDEIIVKALKLSPCVLEECIDQDDAMAKFHPASVNTIRFVTFLKDNELVKMFALLRMGGGGSYVDNAGAGGIVASIDIDTGIIKTEGFREDGTVYLKHPDTGVQIVGARIPCWPELNELIEQLVKVIPEQKYVGWDMALSKKGWCMVEGNSRAMLTGVQMSERRGIRNLIDYTFNLKV